MRCEVCKQEIEQHKYFCDYHWSLVPETIKEEMLKGWGTKKFFRGLLAARRMIKHLENV